MEHAQRPGTAAVRQSRAHRTVAALLALGLLAGCTGPSRSTGSGSPAEHALEALPVEESGARDDYDRLEQFGEWADPDGNGCDARNDVLARDLTGVVVADDGCTVLAGTLEDPYTGRTVVFERGPLTSADVQIDHVVALKNAWESGADRLGADERAALANDPLNLLAVDGPTNGEKSASDAAGWLPPDESHRCEYVATQIAVKTRYGLSVTATERDAMDEVLAGCPEQDVPGDVPAAQEAAATEPSAADEVYYPNCAAVRAAGAAPLRSDQPGYRPALDRGGSEGLACE